MTTYAVTRTEVYTQVVEAVGHDNALNQAMDYGNQYKWDVPEVTYSVVDLPFGVPE
jgi:hypothetical protein